MQRTVQETREIIASSGIPSCCEGSNMLENVLPEMKKASAAKQTFVDRHQNPQQIPHSSACGN